MLNFPSFLELPHYDFFETISFTSLILGTVLIIGRYISSSTQIEQNLKEALEQLDTKNQILEASRQKIQLQNKKLEYANQELERFAYIASHDLKSPLRSVNSFLKLIKRKVKNYQDTSITNEIDKATQRAEQMNLLIQDILNFSKIGIDNTPFVIDLNLIIKVLQLEMSQIFTSKNVTIEVMHQLPAIYANEKQIYLLFNNIIKNGLLYNEDKKPKISISTEINSEYILFKFKDNGIGIAPENQEIVFEMFKRLHLQEQYQGSGVGLAVCKKIITQLNGEIYIKSTLGEGTLCMVKMPIEILRK